MDDIYFKELFLKIEEGTALTADELKNLVYECGLDQKVGDPLRWVTPVRTIIDGIGGLYAIEWYRANSEMQEDEFYYQPYPVTEVKTWKVCITYEKD